MNLSLDETLGSANPHYTRIAREKIAAREAARKAMKARKAAMVEASWCRILQAARSYYCYSFTHVPVNSIFSLMPYIRSPVCANSS